ncbi:MAG: LysR substrate-binding domain-containing protein [Xanthobacteraceae bacterium]
MDLSDLHIFRAVVQAGGITRAAEKLNRVQSNITTRVQQLEQDLGVELFIRNGRKLHLSPAGAILLDYADRLLGLADEAREAVHDTEPRGLLRLGSIESTAAIRLPEPLIEFHRRFPDVKLELRTGVPLGLSAAVLAGELDAALVVEPVADAPFEKLPLFDEELVLVAPPGHPPIASPRDVNPQAVLAFEAHCPYRKRLEQWFAQSGEMPARIIEMSSYHAMLGCAIAGMGIALLPRMVITSTPQAKFLSVHPLPANLCRAPTVLIWRKGALSPKVRALKEILEKAGNKTRAAARKKAA